LAYTSMRPTINTVSGPSQQQTPSVTMVRLAMKLQQRDPEVNEVGVPLGYYSMLHVRYLGMAAAMWNEDINGPMPDDYVPITSIEQWLTMNRTAIIMPPTVLPRG